MTPDPLLALLVTCYRFLNTAFILPFFFVLAFLRSCFFLHSCLLLSSSNSVSLLYILALKLVQLNVTPLVPLFVLVHHSHYRNTIWVY